MAEQQAAEFLGALPAIARNLPAAESPTPTKAHQVEGSYPLHCNNSHQQPSSAIYEGLLGDQEGVDSRPSAIVLTIDEPE